MPRPPRTLSDSFKATGTNKQTGFSPCSPGEVEADLLWRATSASAPQARWETLNFRVQSLELVCFHSSEGLRRLCVDYAGVRAGVQCGLHVAWVFRGACVFHEGAAFGRFRNVVWRVHIQKRA